MSRVISQNQEEVQRLSGRNSDEAQITPAAGGLSRACTTVKESDSVQLIICTVIGAALGIAVQVSDPTDEVVAWLTFPGTLFLRALKCLVIPLIFCNMALGVAEMTSLGNTGKIGVRAIGFFMTTTLFAVLEGMGFTMLFYGFYKEEGASDAASDTAIAGQSVSDTIMGVFNSIFTDNITQATATPDILSVIVFACFFGFVAGKLDLREGEPNHVLLILDQLTKLFNYWIAIILKAAPLAVLSMIAGSFAGTSDFATLFSNVGVLVATCLAGFASHVFMVLPLLFFCVVRQNPYKYQAKCVSAYTFSFASASSAATLPVNMKCIQDMGVVPDPIMRFVLSLGATINMDGSAIYFPAAIVFLAVVSGNGALITASSMFTLVIMCTLGAVGASPIPNAGLVMIVTIWDTVFPGVPIPVQIAYIQAIDWLLDRFVTTVNVCGDGMITQMVAAGVECEAEPAEHMEVVKKTISRQESRISRMSRTILSHIKQPEYATGRHKKQRSKSLKMHLSAPTQCKQEDAAVDMDIYDASERQEVILSLQNNLASPSYSPPHAAAGMDTAAADHIV